MLKSLISAFLMYSRIPMPQIPWKEGNRRFALGWFPAVGEVIGLLLVLWRILCTKIGCGQFLFAAGAVSLPVLVTGGIHLDGYCDVTDARASCADREKKMQIMQDPHIGSFAVIRVCLHLILQAALFSQITTLRQTLVIAFGYILSRSLSGLSAVTFRAAKKTGTLQSFVKPSHKNMTIAMVCFWALLAYVGMLCSYYSAGAAAAGAAVIIFLHYHYFARKEFGGTSGDLCGWFLQRCELGMLAAAVLIMLVTEGFK